MKNIFNVSAVKSEQQTLVQVLHILYSLLKAAERQITVQENTGHHKTLQDVRNNSQHI
jgi:hypothetical protein